MTTQSKKPVSRGNTMLMTAKQMSVVSGIGENTLRRLMECGNLEYLQIGSHRLLCQNAIWDYYERHKTPVGSPAPARRAPNERKEY